MLQRSIGAIGVAQKGGFPGCDAPGIGQGRQRVERCRRAQRGIPAAKQQLVNLREKLHFANPAAAALQIKARPQRLAFGKMIADLVAHFADVGQRRIVQAAPPDEGCDGGEKILPQPHVSGGSAGADEGRTLPRQRLALIIAFGRTHRQG